MHNQTQIQVRPLHTFLNLAFFLIFSSLHSLRGFPILHPTLWPPWNYPQPHASPVSMQFSWSYLLYITDCVKLLLLFRRLVITGAFIIGFKNWMHNTVWKIVCINQIHDSDKCTHSFSAPFTSTLFVHVVLQGINLVYNVIVVHNYCCTFFVFRVLFDCSCRSIFSAR